MTMLPSYRKTPYPYFGFIVEKTQKNEAVEPKTKYYQKIKRQPPPLVQDLRPEVLGMALILT